MTLTSEDPAADPAAAFASLSESEQRAVAERLLLIEESGWKPFWCDDPHCDGMPHLDPDREGDYAPAYFDAGPGGEPLSRVVYEDQNGDLYESKDDLPEDPEDTVVGKMYLDPAWAHNHAREDQRLPVWNDPWTLPSISGPDIVMR